jgi:hypothetical protein
LMRPVVPRLRQHHQLQLQGSPWKLHLNQEGTSMSATHSMIRFQFIHPSISHEKWQLLNLLNLFKISLCPLVLNNIEIIPLKKLQIKESNSEVTALMLLQ